MIDYVGFSRYALVPNYWVYDGTTEYMTDIVEFALQRATNIHYRRNVGH